MTHLQAIRKLDIYLYLILTCQYYDLQEQFELAVNHELAAKYNGMQLRDTTELNQATKVEI